MPEAENLRIANGLADVRRPTKTLGGSLTQPLFRGAYECLLDGVPTLFVVGSTAPGIVPASFDGAISNDDGATFTSIFPSSGKYGDTRFDGFTSGGGVPGRIEAQVVQDRPLPDRAGFDCLVIQNGKDAPRIYSKGGTFAGYGTSVVYPVPAPIANSELGASLTFTHHFLINDPVQTTYTNSDASKFKLQDAGVTVSLNSIFGQLFSTFTPGVTSKVRFSTAIDLSSAAQFVLMGNNHSDVGINGATNAAPIVVTTGSAHGLQVGDTVIVSGVGGNTAANGRWEVNPLTSTTFELTGSTGNAAYTSGGSVQTQGVANFWQQMGVALLDGSGNAMPLYDPSTSSNATFLQNDFDPLVSAWQMAYQLQPVSPFDLTNVVAVSLFWTGQAPPIEVDFNIYLLAGGGRFQGTTAFAVSYFGSDFRGMGPATPVPTTLPGSILNSGGPDPTQGGSGVFFPPIAEDARFFYDPLITFPSPPVPAIAAGVNNALLFAQYPEQTNLFLNATAIAAVYAGSGPWTVDSTDFAELTGATYFQQDLSWPALDASYVTLPIGLPMAASTQRLMVGQGNRFWYSGAERPFQFRELVANDGNGNLQPNSPGSFGIDGEEIQAFLNIGSLSAGQETIGQAQNGVSTVFIITDRSTSWVTGWDAISLNKRNLLYGRGTYAPKSVAPSRTGFFFLDSDRRLVEVMGYSVQPVSRDIVDDRLNGIPDARVPWIWGVERDDRYYLCYTPEGETENSRALIYDVHESQVYGEHVWLSDTFSTAIEGVSCLLPYRDGVRTRLVGFDLACAAIEHEANGTDDQGQTGVTWSMTFPELKADLFSSIRVRRCGVVCDANMGTITTTRAAVGRIDLPTSSASIDTSTPTGPRAVKWDSPAAGILSNSVSLSLSGASPSGSKLINVVVEVGPIAVDGPDA